MAEKTADVPNETTTTNTLEREQDRWVTAAVIFLILATVCLAGACVAAAARGNAETALLAAGALMALFFYLASNIGVNYQRG